MKDQGTLINCPTCNAQMSSLASACPSCAAPNTWIHPEIKRLKQLIDSTDFDVENSWKYPLDRMSIAGHIDLDKVEQEAPTSGRTWAVTVIAVAIGAALYFWLAKSFYFMGPLWLAIYSGIAGVGAWYCARTLDKAEFQSRIVRNEAPVFKITIVDGRPAWTSNDDAYWKDVRQKLGL